MKILLSGYFGFGNTGDEMIHFVLKQHLKEKGLETISLVKNPVSNEEVDRTNLKDIYNAIKLSDVVISGGGGLLQDKTSSKSFFYYLSIIWLAKKMGRKTIVLAQGIGPVEKSFNKRIMGRIINMADIITVRDANSKELLIESGANKRIFVTADLAFLYPIKEQQKNDEYILVSFGKHTTNPALKTLIEIVNFVKEKSNKKVALLPLFPEKDKEIMENVANATGTNIVGISSIDKIISIFKSSIFAIGTRYHALVLSTMTHVPFIGLSYDPKVDILAHEIDIPILPYNNSLSLTEFKKVFEKALEEKENMGTRLQKKCKELKERAEENFNLIYDFILD